MKQQLRDPAGHDATRKADGYGVVQHILHVDRRPRTQNPAIPFPNMRPIGEVGAPPTKCRWPMWNDQERATHVYCGARVVANKPYCAAHCRRAYYTAGPVPKADYLLKERVPLADLAPQAVPAKRTKKPAVKKKRHAKRTKPTGLGPGVYVRMSPPIDIRLCVNDTERQIVAAWNGGRSQREIARELGVSHNSIAGKCWRIRARRLEE